jgi:hypothetical protein
MFAYNPGVTDISGKIRAEADIARAQRQQQAIMDGAGLVGDAAKAVVGFAVGGPAGAAMASGGGGGGEGSGGGGGLFDTIIGAYAQKEQDKSDSKMYGNLMKIVAPAFGKDGDSMLEQWNSLESDRDRAQFGGTLFSSLGQISNMYMANRNAGIRENQQMMNSPGARALAGNRQAITNQGGPSIMGATRRIGTPTGP